MHDKKISLSLLILRLSIGAFFGVWSSLKFYRPEWFENVFKNAYGLEFVTSHMGTAVGIVQVVIVVAFVLGFMRSLSYAVLALMQAAGVLASIPNLINFTQYPNNLMWAAVPALGAAIALFLLREYDTYTIDGWRKARVKA
ncbi:putative membrane protein YphA (DoxX/SURF4 family) [Sulfitobacter undariae]|uniref:Putative membrane protein YphA (DoxX/SURF4 family) n=1 Tax=Sulfitobacter undariae TaxID=1563671 RepID=A0A7W6H2C9_9RHOB|nr:DoxX protein [Sulfitobacter undariae]MBB3995703.1 putative membrane protein YphA (DoxX/SURF4 family) [Sulfitobacter undariae]